MPNAGNTTTAKSAVAASGTASVNHQRAIQIATAKVVRPGESSGVFAAPTSTNVNNARLRPGHKGNRAREVAVLCR